MVKPGRIKLRLYVHVLVRAPAAMHMDRGYHLLACAEKVVGGGGGTVGLAVAVPDVAWMPHAKIKMHACRRGQW